MEAYFLSDDIQIVYVPATRFPEGISQCFDTLRSSLTSSSERRYYGLSRPEGSKIVYKAAAERLVADEDKDLNLPGMSIKAGNYAAIVVENYTQNLQRIGDAFQEILALENLDPNGYCVECYLTADQVRCMVRLEP